jgi:hypothetical protein
MALAFEPRKQAGTLAEAIEKQAAAQKRAAETKALMGGSSSGGMLDPFTALQQQLFNQANSIRVAATPLEQLRSMAEQQVGLQYDPQIAALGQEVRTHQKRAGRSEKQARSMYGALAQDYLSQLPDMTAQYAAEDQATNQRYQQAQDQMQGNYDKNAQQQDAVLKQLGIQAAAPDASQQAKDDNAYFANQSKLDQQTALDALNEQQNSQMDYTRNLGNNARMAGENTAQDIGQQLSDYLGQAESAMTTLRGQKGAAIEALLSQMQQQDQQRVQSQQQQEFSNMMQLFNFQLSAQKAAADAAAKASAGSGAGGFGSGTGTSSLTTGLPGAQNYLASQYPDQPILASNLMEMLNNVLANKDVTNGKYVLDPGDPSLGRAPKYSDVGQQYMERLLRQQFQQQGNRYNNQDINATMAALEAYLGKLR